MFPTPTPMSFILGKNLVFIGSALWNSLALMGSALGNDLMPHSQP